MRLLDERRSIGRGRVQVSALGFGAAPIGNLYSPVAEDVAQAAVHEALQGGIRYFDTAPFYGYGLSEQRLGRALAGAPRHSYVVSTKVGRLIEPDVEAKDGSDDGFAVAYGRAAFDYSRTGVQRSFEASIRRLGIEHVDILLLHDVGRRTHGDRHPEVMKQALDEALPAMAELRESGAVAAIGVGVNEQAVCLELLPRTDLDCIMLAGRYTLFEQRESEELLAQAHERSVKVIVAGPYNSGLLANSRGPGETYDYKQVDAATLERARKIYEQCSLENVDAGAAALQFPLAHPAVASVVAGQRSAEEVTSAIERLNARIPARLWARFKDVGLIDRSTVTPGR
jgi:D-threo-aldose 1-dehydrogenase